MKQRRRSTGLAATMLPLLAGGAAFLAADILRRAYTRSRLFAPSPDPVKSWDPADYGIPPASVEVLEFPTPDGQRLYGWYCRAEHPVASALFCHGNTGNLTISADTIPHLLAAGLNVLFFDYRGFGLSTGKPTYDGVISDAVTAARLHDRLRPQHLPSVLYGFSLGGAIAAQLLRSFLGVPRVPRSSSVNTATTAEEPRGTEELRGTPPPHPFDGLILHSTFTSLGALTRLLFPRMPLHLLGRHLFNTISVVRKLDMPLLVLHGTADEVVPCSMAHELFGACTTERKQLHCVDGALHKTLFQTDPDTLVWLIAQFISGLRQRASIPSPEPAPLLARYTDTVRRSLRRKAPQEA